MFSPEKMMYFQLFSGEHLLTLLLFVLFASGILWCFSRYTDFKWLGTILAGTLCISETSYQIWMAYHGLWAIQTALPLQLCSISTFIGIYLYFKRNSRLFYLFLYIGFIPPILALITPDNPYSFPHFRYIKYFIHHMAIPLMVLYLFYFDHYPLRKRSILYGFGLLNCLAVPIYILNKLIGSNYFFLSGPPEGNTPLLWFGDGIVYIFNLEIAALFVFSLNYLMFKMLAGRRKNQKMSRLRSHETNET
ncbi:TIGR02206 family membrane protein [Bacillus sp. Marseille-Q1617]|uniref:YwaF family protein n=1 Tax=Bacillus sp. Marseille-Q1617 TaxID=2736887 RepID=UPI00158E0B90|nr:TIGR02206 family membrane protein [Bacillus sp. Marseille-Q1617]